MKPIHSTVRLTIVPAMALQSLDLVTSTLSTIA